jgi:hypothetical protein
MRCVPSCLLTCSVVQASLAVLAGSLDLNHDQAGTKWVPYYLSAFRFVVRRVGGRSAQPSHPCTSSLRPCLRRTSCTYVGHRHAPRVWAHEGRLCGDNG